MTVRRVVAVRVIVTGVLVALLGVLASLIAWAVNSLHSDGVPNTLLEDLSPLLLLVLPAVGMGVVLGFCGRDLWRESDLIARRPISAAVYMFTGLAAMFFVAWVVGSLFV